MPSWGAIVWTIVLVMCVMKLAVYAGYALWLLVGR